ncbi:MAG: ComF family protein [Arcobacteraceae bacterium]
MKCTVCQKFSWEIICQTCQKNLLVPNLHKREVDKDFFVYSFYNHSEISELLNAKYHFFGDKIYNILAKHTLKQFATSFTYPNTVGAIPIDDTVNDNFSHTAILAKNLQSKIIKPYYNVLKATNKVKYAGQTLDFRQKHKRDFRYSGKSYLDVILVDDIITTGLTMVEAREILQQNGCNVLFGVALSDAKF